MILLKPAASVISRCDIKELDENNEGLAMADYEIQAEDGRAISFADFGKPGDIAVLCCHGGPGSRMEMKASAEEANSAGFRLIGVDRPGYGKSTALPGRSISDWTKDALAIADHLGLHKFMTLGNSTGGSYALAIASVAPDRVLGVMVGCGMSDMHWANTVEEARMPASGSIWRATNRDEYLTIASDQFGEHGEKMLEPAPDAPPMLSPPDLALVSDPAYGANDPDNEPFRQGVVGYADDRIADGPQTGWSSFDINKVVCPVMIIHGEQDWIVPISHAYHTASLLENALIKTFPEHGHLSLGTEIVGALVELLARVELEPT
ncbi:MAG: pimeloyl-ACP methyl ester carboxylesterase [Candidatus Azotimanducaceae bacterium]